MGLKELKEVEGSARTYRLVGIALETGMSERLTLARVFTHQFVDQ